MGHDFILIIETDILFRFEVKKGGDDLQYMKEDKVKMVENFVNRFVEVNGVSPSNRQISDGTGLPLTTVSRYLHYMRDQGLISFQGCRSITTRQQEQIRKSELNVPILGRVACGLPILAEENIEEYVHLPVSLFGRGNFYILRACGDSMIEAGINSDDLVLIRQADTAEPGQIVVALTGEEATLKRYFPEPENHRVRLHPENHTMTDIYVDSCVIQGVAKMVLKDL